MNKQYVLRSEWCVEGESGDEILGVYRSYKEALKAFKQRVIWEREDALSCNYKISEDSDGCFEASVEGFYATDHITLRIQEPTQQTSPPLCDNLFCEDVTGVIGQWLDMDCSNIPSEAMRHLYTAYEMCSVYLQNPLLYRERYEK